MGKYSKLTESLVNFEKGNITEVDDIIEFAQLLVDNGLDTTKCGGHYSRIVQELINQGKVSKDKRLQSISWLDSLSFD